MYWVWHYHVCLSANGEGMYIACIWSWFYSNSTLHWAPTAKALILNKYMYIFKYLWKLIMHGRTSSLLVLSISIGMSIFISGVLFEEFLSFWRKTETWNKNFGVYFVWFMCLKNLKISIKVFPIWGHNQKKCCNLFNGFHLILKFLSKNK